MAWSVADKSRLSHQSIRYSAREGDRSCGRGGEERGHAFAEDPRVRIANPGNVPIQHSSGSAAPSSTLCALGYAHTTNSVPRIPIHCQLVGRKHLMHNPTSHRSSIASRPGVAQPRAFGNFAGTVDAALSVMVDNIRTVRVDWISVFVLFAGVPSPRSWRSISMSLTFLKETISFAVRNCRMVSLTALSRVPLGQHFRTQSSGALEKEGYGIIALSGRID